LQRFRRFLRSQTANVHAGNGHAGVDALAVSIFVAGDEYGQADGKENQHRQRGDEEKADIPPEATASGGGWCWDCFHNDEL
jgi:hypothetical protein